MTVFWHQSCFKPYYRKLSLAIVLTLVLTVLGACTNNPADLEPTDGKRTLQDNEFLMDELTRSREPNFTLLKADVDDEGRMYALIAIAMGVTETIYAEEPFDFKDEGVLTLLHVEIMDAPSDPDALGGGNRAIFRYEKSS